MSTFDSTKMQLSELLRRVHEGKLQLPDFQRGWVWDDEHIRSLLVSIARSFPIGAVMLLETGGETSFQTRPIEGVAQSNPNYGQPEALILDGQQRLTSLTQVLKLASAVQTRDTKKRELRLHYYINIEKALEGPAALVEAVVAVDEKKTMRSDFGRRIDIDLTTPALEIEHFYFPCDQILDSSNWEYGLMAFPDKMKRFMDFRRQVLDPFRNYMLPVISLRKETSKEAVCLVFEKVNTGGVPLSVFELVTATWATDAFNLREDWAGKGGNEVGRYGRLRKKQLLRDIEPTDFLQGISLLHSLEQRENDTKIGKSGKELTGVSAKREHILVMPLSAYKKWAEPLTLGFEQAERFLRKEGFHHPKFLPYRTQVTPLAVLMAQLKERWLEPRIHAKLARWFWSGVLGELYGSAVEGRFANDVQQMPRWIEDDSVPEPDTVQAAGFNPNRLDTLRSRTSAAYRGMYVLLQREGACDFFWKSRMVDLDRDDVKLDIHHIFPKKWCIASGIMPAVYNSIVNKSAISYKANRMIGGRAPSAYLRQLQDHAQVGISDAEMNAILGSHLIEPGVLRSDDFKGFYEARKARLLALVEKVIGKAADPKVETEDDEIDDDEESLDQE